MFSGLTFHAGAIAAAGLVAAAAPVIIHLLNRRRYRVVQWAAMDFLREALSRSRRAIELRDVLLMALRSLCLLLLGLALARPYFSASSASSSSSGPVHAVLVIDNSLSMAYERLDGTLLDAAKAKAREVLDQLPLGSRTSIIPLCASPGEFSWDAYRTQEDSLEALRMIEVVDRAGHASQAIERAREACRAVADLATKRVVFIGDQQAANWPRSIADLDDSTGGPDALEMHVMAVGADEAENSWIADIQLRDGLADTESDSVFQLRVRHEGPRPRPNVQVTLYLDGAEVGSSTIDLEPGQTREVSFTHRFDSPPESGQATFVAAEARLSPDRLPADDHRALVVSVVAALPVVFVDQYGDEETPDRNEYGETFRLRRLLAPVTVRSEAGRQLVQVRRARIDQVDRELLADARLVVVAGVEKPDPAVAVLREYVQQGGQLLIAAGAEFSPAHWQRAAWLDGAGILPAPLLPELVGSLPNKASANLQPFFLSFDSMSHDLFQLADVPREELADLYQLPYFFQTVATDLGETTVDVVLAADQERIETERQFLKESDLRQARWVEDEAKGALTDEQQAARAQDQRRRDEIQPHWLRWVQAAEAANDSELPAEGAARRMRPRVLARYTNNLPFLIERNIGRGQVLFCSTGVQSDWNTLTKTNAVLLFDRLFRAALARTLPRRNLSSSEPVVLAIAAEDRRAALSVRRPESTLDEPLVAEALQSDQFGVTIRNAAQRGIYRITARQSALPGGGAVEEKLWEILLSVSGPQEESQLAALDQASWQERVGDAPFRWTAPGETINLSGVRVRGEGLWRWLLAGVLACLLAEIAILAYMGRKPSNSSVAATTSVSKSAEAIPGKSRSASPPTPQEVRA